MKTRLLLFALFVSSMLQAQWEQLPMPDCDNLQFLGTAHNRVWTQCDSGQNYLSDDQGETWQHWTLSDTTEARKIWISDQELLALSRWTTPFAQYEETIYRSTDNGDTWQAVFYDAVHQFHIDKVFSAGGFIFFVGSIPSTWGSSLFRSGDKGATWQNMDVNGNGTWENQLFGGYAGGNVLIAEICEQDGIGSAWCYDLKSFDFGQTWEGLGVPFDPLEFINDHYWVLMGESNDPNIYFSNDAGVTLSTLPRSDCRHNYYYAPPYSLYSFYSSSVNNSCLELWNNDTHTWQHLTAPPVYYSYLIQTELGTLFAGTHETGLWRFPAPSSSVGTPDSKSSAFLSISPNPAQQEVEIEWPTDTPPESPLFVWDLYGKLILQVSSSHSPTFKLNVSTWQPGFYFLKVGRHTGRLIKN